MRKGGGEEGEGEEGGGEKGGGEAMEKERVQEGHHFLKCLIPPPDLE